MQQAMADAVVLTARLWEAAWKAGNGKSTIKKTAAILEEELKELYECKEGFLDSLKLEDMVELQPHGRAGRTSASNHAVRRSKGQHAAAHVMR